MTLEQQVCSLELAKRLKELGVQQESYFNWILNANDNWLVWDDTMRSDYETGREKDAISAFTVAELGEMLPQGYVTWWYAKQDGQATTLWRCAASVYDDERIAEEALTEPDGDAHLHITVFSCPLSHSQ